MKKNNTLIMIRNTLPEDIPKLVKLQEDSFPYLARYGNVWHPQELESHLRVFPEGQFCAERACFLNHFPKSKLFYYSTCRYYE
jgi:hypothetical protein